MTSEGAIRTAARAGKWLENKLMYSIGFGAVLLIAAGVGLFYLIGDGNPSARVVRIGYVEGGVVRKNFLEHMAAEGRKHHLDIRVAATNSKTQMLSLVDGDELDLGVISGGVESSVPRSIFEVAPLYMEPLHLLVKADLHEQVSADYGQLKGRTISMDGRDSATSVLAIELLRFSGINDPATGAPLYNMVNMTQAQLMSETDGRRLPDAVFQIAGMPSPTIRHLVANHGYRLVPLPFGESFNLDRFRDAEAAPPAGDSQLRLNKLLIEEFVVPAFAYSVTPPVPPADTRTLATRLLLIASDNFDEELVRRVLEVVLTPEISSLARPPLSLDVLSAPFQFERHPGTDRYMSSLRPFDLDGTFLMHQRMVEAWGVLIAAYVMGTRGVRWWRERKATERKRPSSDFLRQILDIEAEAAASTGTTHREALDQRLSDIKKSSIELQLAGQLEDPENMASLLVTLADTRIRIWRAAST
jgi:TRAP-type uncharacterized transport system substrate-binding protein